MRSAKRTFKDVPLLDREKSAKLTWKFYVLRERMPKCGILCVEGEQL